MIKSVVTYATFHQGLFIPHLGHLGTVLPSSSKTIPDLKMHTEEEGLVIIAKNVTLLVPYGNVALMSIGAPYEEPKVLEFKTKSPADPTKGPRPA